MVVPVFTDEDLKALRRFPEIGREELFRFFTLTPGRCRVHRGAGDNGARNRVRPSGLLNTPGRGRVSA